MDDRYVLLTGAIDNAGDFLIADRAVRVLAALRPDRKTVCRDRWKPLPAQDLDLINGSRALLLTGGPAVRRNIYPGIYPLVPDLSRIRVPVVAFGIGQKLEDCTAATRKRFGFDPSAEPLLEILRRSPVRHSVRDRVSAELLASAGIDRVAVTGCPALFGPAFTGANEVKIASDPSKVVFSLGVSFLASTSMEKLMRTAILLVRDRFPGKRFVVALHHSGQAIAKTGKRQAISQQRMLDWLDSREIERQDVSGSLAAMTALYGDAAFHCGFRVHAHILMTSMDRPSLLLAEDCRATALGELLGEGIITAVRKIDRSLGFRGLARIAGMFGIPTDRYRPARDTPLILARGLGTVGPSAGGAVTEKVKGLWAEMKKFAEALP